MAALEVAAVVFSLISAFRSGIDVVHRVRDRRRVLCARRRRVKEDDERETALTRSLGKGPGEIGRVYEKDLAVVGDEFARGDLVARTSLAETLLKLNTGLVNIISSFLLVGNDGKSDASLDYTSLIRLSEDSRINAIDALDGLFRRLSVGPRVVVLREEKKKKQGGLKRKTKERVVTETVSEKKKVPARSRRLVVYGPWLTGKPTQRKKNQSRSPAQTKEKKQSSKGKDGRSLVRAGGRGRTPSSSSASSSASSSSSSTIVASKSASSSSTVATPMSTTAKSPKTSSTTTPRQVRSKRGSTPHSSPTSQNQTPPARQKISADVLEAQRSHFKPEHKSTTVSGAPTSTLRPAVLSTMTPRRLTPSMYSFASDSTKLGEIPDYKLIGQSSSLTNNHIPSNDLITGVDMEPANFWNPSRQMMAQQQLHLNTLSPVMENVVVAGTTRVAEYSVAVSETNSNTKGRRGFWRWFRRRSTSTDGGEDGTSTRDDGGILLYP